MRPKLQRGAVEWSPDGQTLAFVGERNGEFDIYSILAGGENRLDGQGPGGCGKEEVLRHHTPTVFVEVECMR